MTRKSDLEDAYQEISEKLEELTDALSNGPGVGAYAVVLVSDNEEVASMFGFRTRGPMTLMGAMTKVAQEIGEKRTTMRRMGDPRKENVTTN